MKITLSKTTSDIIKALDEKKRKPNESIQDYFKRLVSIGKKKKS